jgi:hypothetical protein
MKRVAILIGCLVAATAAARPYRLPPEAPRLLPEAPDAALVAAHCGSCHSLDYVTTQPRGKPAAFWRDAVTKMIGVYGAPIEKDDADRIATYLAKTYGAH